MNWKLYTTHVASFGVYSFGGDKVCTCIGRSVIDIDLCFIIYESWHGGKYWNHGNQQVQQTI